MKKLFALFLAVVMCAAMVLPAYGDAATPTGTIIVNNAEHGWTYRLVKAFDAQVSAPEEGSTKINVTYSIDSTQNAGLYNLIAGNKTYKDGEKEIANPFVLHATTAGSTEYTVAHKEDTQHSEFGRGWLYGWYKAAGGWSGEETTKELAPTEKNVLTFTDLPYGYYMIYKTKNGTEPLEKGAIASVVTLDTERVTISDKNPRSPGDPEKEVKVGDTYASTKEVQVGDVVEYRASFMATNYRTYENMSSQQIKSYTIRDDAKGLKYKSLDKMTIYTTKDKNGNFDGKVKEWVWPNEEQKVAPYEADTKYGGYSMTIPWVNDQGESLYPSPCYIVLEYKMYVTEAVLSSLYNNTATNTFSPSFTIDSEPIHIDNPPSVKVYTTGLSLIKTDPSGHTLPGSQFILSKVDGNTETYYTLADRKSEKTGEEWKDVEWVASKDQALTVTVSNSPDTQTFGGLSSGTYRLYEMDHPDGYEFPGFDYWEIEISYDAKQTNPFSATIKTSAEGAEETTLPLYTPEGGTARNYFTVTIVNHGGSALPQTGAAGTTMLLLVGGTMFAVAMLFLVTKKRLYNEG